MQSLSLLPRPQSLAAGEGEFVLAGARRIALDADVPADLAGAAARLQSALRAASAEWPLVAAPLGTPLPAGDAGVTLRVAPERVAHAQGYELTIAPDGVLIEAHDAAGVFYAVCTLIQIVEQSGGRLPALRIADWPDFAARGVMLDISRDKVPTMETLFGLVDMLAGWKINQLQLYTEHTFAYSRHPEVWANASPITGEEILRLDQFCRERFIELVPNQTTFGHMHRWLKLDRYHDLAETHDRFNTPWGVTMAGPFSLRPGHPGSIALVRDLLDELLPHFRSRTVNINCDETIDLGQGLSRAEGEQRGIGRVYLDFLLQIAGEVRARGRAMQDWGDIIIDYPELIPELPPDGVALEWGYEATHPFAEHGAKFAASGIPFYVCPGTSSWCSIAGRTDNALGNLRSAAENGLSNGAIGYLITDWGDRGHWQQLPISYLGFAAGAAYAWACEANRDLDIVDALDRFAFRDRAGAMGRLAYDLGNVYRALGIVTHNSSALFWVLQPLEGRPGAEVLKREDIERGLAAIDAAMSGLSRAQMDRPDAALIAQEFEQTAHLLRHACRHGLLLLDPDQSGAAELRRELDRDLRQIIDEQRRLWLARNRPGGLSDSVARLERVLTHYQG
jgi:hypothetical protein